MTKNIEKEIINELKSLSDKDFAKWVAPILQITENGYGNGDKLYGIRTPILRNTAKNVSRQTVKKQPGGHSFTHLQLDSKVLQTLSLLRKLQITSEQFIMKFTLRFRKHSMHSLM